jgi:hypothetical protein
VLHLIERVRAFFNRDAITIANQPFQLCLFRLQYVSELVQLTLGHVCLTFVSVSSFIDF